MFLFMFSKSYIFKRMLEKHWWEWKTCNTGMCLWEYQYGIALKQLYTLAQKVIHSNRAAELLLGIHLQWTDSRSRKPADTKDLIIAGFGKAVKIKLLGLDNLTKKTVYKANYLSKPKTCTVLKIMSLLDLMNLMNNEPVSMPYKQHPYCIKQPVESTFQKNFPLRFHSNEI